MIKISDLYKWQKIDPLFDQRMPESQSLRQQSEEKGKNPFSVDESKKSLSDQWMEGELLSEAEARVKNVSAHKISAVAEYYNKKQIKTYNSLILFNPTYYIHFEISIDDLPEEVARLIQPGEMIQFEGKILKFRVEDKWKIMEGGFKERNPDCRINIQLGKIKVIPVHILSDSLIDYRVLKARKSAIRQMIFKSFAGLVIGILVGWFMGEALKDLYSVLTKKTDLVMEIMIITAGVVGSLVGYFLKIHKKRSGYSY